MLDTVTLASADGMLAAEFVPGAGMLCRSLRKRREELLGQGKGVAAYAEKGATMGIPLLYPWANRLARWGYEAAGHRVELQEGSPMFATDHNGLPIHGVIARHLPWRVGEIPPEASALSASLDWEDPALLAIFPFPHRLDFDARLGADSLTISVTLHATGSEPVPVSFGFHPYFVLGGVARREWLVALPATERLLLDAKMIPTGAQEPIGSEALPLGDRGWDDAFGGLSEPARFAARGGERVIEVEFLAGYDYAQVYSPADAEFICIEPMTAPTNALDSGDGLPTVPPGGSYRGSFRVAIRRNHA